MKTFLIVAVIAILAIGLIGVLVEALLWLSGLAVVLFVALVLWWWVRAKWNSRNDVETTA